MRTRKPRRNHPKRISSDGTVRIDTQAGRWILLPGGGFGLRAPSTWDGKFPA